MENQPFTDETILGKTWKTFSISVWSQAAKSLWFCRLKLLQKESRQVALFASRTRHIMRGEWRCAAEKLHSTPNSTVAPRPVQGWKSVVWKLQNGGTKAKIVITVFFSKTTWLMNVDESYQPLTMAYWFSSLGYRKNYPSYPARFAGKSTIKSLDDSHSWKPLSSSGIPHDRWEFQDPKLEVR